MVGQYSTYLLLETRSLDHYYLCKQILGIAVPTHQPTEQISRGTVKPQCHLQLLEHSISHICAGIPFSQC